MATLSGSRSTPSAPKDSAGDRRSTRGPIRSLGPRRLRLRARLERYYATEGVGEPIVITLPKGSYVPQLQSRSTAAQR